MIGLRTSISWKLKCRETKWTLHRTHKPYPRSGDDLSNQKIFLCWIILRDYKALVRSGDLSPIFFICNSFQMWNWQEDSLRRWEHYCHLGVQITHHSSEGFAHTYIRLDIRRKIWKGVNTYKCVLGYLDHIARCVNDEIQIWYRHAKVQCSGLNVDQKNP